MSWFLGLPYLLRVAIGLVAAFSVMLGIANLSSRRQDSELVWATGSKAVRHKVSRIPLTVYLDDSFGDSHRDSLLRAIEDMNAIGCTLAVIAENPEEPAIHIRHEACDKSSEHPGCTWLNLKSSQIVIQIGRPGNVTMSYLLFFHELTHAFGLAHDGIYPVPSNSDALMFIPVTANNAFEHSSRLGQGKLLPGLSGKDSAAMRERYCPHLK